MRNRIEQKAKGLVLEELRHHGWTGQDMEKQRKPRAARVRMATRLRCETVMAWDWSAERSRLGCRHTMASCLKG